MECDETDNAGVNSIDGSNAVVNSVILDYYKKFGRKRDLEQFFSLSTAESEVRDVKSLFWRRMKSHTDSSDSGEKKSESSTELCRISIKCSLPEPCSSQDETTKTKSDSESPPIITEEIPSQHTDEESINDDNQSQKSMDATLDTSANKPLSPTSSITSQRKLEWDSLADVGYGNESDRKTSASSLSTLERLALKQQYSNNDSQENNELGPPTAHSTPVDATETKSKSKKGGIKKTTKIYKKDVDVVEVSLPHGMERNPSQAINVNLTKHISFNMEKDGGISLDNITKDLNVTPENIPVASEVLPHVRMDKEIQTTLPKTKEKSFSPETSHQPASDMYQRIPVLINLNTLKKKYRKKKLKVTRRKLRSKKKDTADKENIPVQEKSTEQVSAAESFEYMPGHVYNQNQMNLEQPVSGNITGNKSSLESSGAVTTTESSNDSKHSFTKDLEKSIELLKAALRRSHNDSELKNKLIKEVVQRLLKNKYRDDESTTDFLSGLSFSSKKLGLGESQTTTSTSDSNNTVSSKLMRPKKSILRLDKFNPSLLPSASQSAPNLPSVSKSEKPLISNLRQPITPNTESDVSSGGKNSSGMAPSKASSGELYQKYLEALKREEAYKKHLKDKEMFLKQKLVCSDTAFKVPQSDTRVNNKLKDLIKDLTRNNYDDGSGDASKLEGGSNSNVDQHRYNTIKKQKSHSVFTLSSGNSDDQNRKANLKKNLQNERKETKAGHSKDSHHCCCPHRYVIPKVELADSSVQVNIKDVSNESSAERQRQQVAPLPGSSHGSNKNSPRNIAHVLSDDLTGDIQYVCLCNNKPVSKEHIPDNMLIYKCSRLTTTGAQLENAASKTSNTVGVQCIADSRPLTSEGRNMPSVCNGKTNIQSSSSSENLREMDRMSKSSQTNLAIRMLQRKSSDRSFASSSSSEKKTSPKSVTSSELNKVFVHEATRSVQTDISINPKISDPSLADINIVNELDCVKLISERFRESSKRNSETDLKSIPTKDHNKPNTASEYSLRILRSENIRGEELIRNSPPHTPKRYPTVDKEVQSNEENNNEVQSEILDEAKKLDSENFTIPIQGTNMTLMVKIGSKGNKIEDITTNNEFTTQCVGTDKADVNEKATCLTDECSKGVQSQTTDIFSIIDKDLKQSPRQTDYEPNIVSQTKDLTNAFNQCCLVNACTGGTSVRNTYPRNVQINSKPFLRSNTDTGRFVTGSVQTESVEKINAVVQQDSPTPEIGDSQKFVQSDSDKKCNCPSEKSSKSGDDSQKSGESDSNGKSKLFSEKSYKTDSNKERKDNSSEAQSRKSSSEGDRDAILDIIKDITKRYSKKDIEKSKKKKCFKEIVTVLNYLLDTEDGTDNEPVRLSESSSTLKSDHGKTKKVQEKPAKPNSEFELPENLSKKVDKAVQLTPKKSKATKHSTDSSEIPATTDFPGTSSDSATCKVLSKIKRECEKYHLRRCKSHGKKNCEGSSSTSVNCDQCKRVHHCPCRGHRCHKSKSSADKPKKKCVAYNLIIQTSDSMISEETVYDNGSKPLQNIVVKVPSRRKHMEKMPFNEVSAKIEKNLPRCSPRVDVKTHRSRSCPNDSEISSIDEYAKKNCGYSVRDYLEQNRPDFVEKTSSRQQCLKIISEKRATDRSAHRQLLSVQLDRQPKVTDLSEEELRRLARDLGVELRRKKDAPKFINEREMKKHSELIYKSLPEVVQKKEELKKDNVKKTNLLMANIFKKNLQKKTLRGAVNLSNYSTVIKI